MTDLRHQARAGFTANRLFEASVLYGRLLAVNKKDLEALQMLGTICQRTGKLDEAERYFRRAIKFNKKNHELYYQLGTLLLDLGRGKEALDALQQAVTIERNFFEPWVLLGNIHAFNGMLGKAMTAYRNAIRINPNHPVPHSNLGNVLADLGDSGQAFEQWRKALVLKPDYLEAHSNTLLGMNYGTGLSRDEIYHAHKQWAQRHFAGIRRREDFSNRSDPGKRIRIGYVSPDFREHSVAYYLSPIIENYSRDENEVFLYSNVAKPDQRTAWFCEKADHFRDISMLSDADAARQIEQDGIDILVDLAGHTSGNRLAIFARKPAPVQLTYLGYPNTTGLMEMDYRLTDRYADPVGGGADTFYTESLVRLKRGFLCYQPPADAPDEGSLPCLERGYVTFGSFNYTAKITADVIVVWAEILKQVPSSSLLLKYRSYSDPAARKYYLSHFEQLGVGAERIRFLGLTPSKQEHLKCYHEVDIALDTFPYNGTTTTCDTLWMGVPVIVLEGETHAGRVGFSILKHIGLEDCLASSKDDYIRRATELATNAKQLNALRMVIRRKMSSSMLCQPVEFVSELDNAVQGDMGRLVPSDSPHSKLTVAFKIR